MLYWTPRGLFSNVPRSLAYPLYTYPDSASNSTYILLLTSYSAPLRRMFLTATCKRITNHPRSTSVRVCSSVLSFVPGHANVHSPRPNIPPTRTTGDPMVYRRCSELRSTHQALQTVCAPPVSFPSVSQSRRSLPWPFLVAHAAVASCCFYPQCFASLAQTKVVRRPQAF